VEDGTSPRTVTTFHEEESRIAFQQGKAVFLRNWPYVWPLSQTDPGSKVKGKVGVAPLPGFEGQSPATVLGGKNLGISRFTKHPEEAFDAIQCIASAKNQRRLLEVKGNLPALQAVYDVPELQQKIPFLSTARDALDVAHPRPITPYYNDVTIALARAANEATSGVATPEEAVAKADKAIQSGIDGEGEI
jgi:multiple sugar transport system substrate-binding protein